MGFKEWKEVKLEEVVDVLGDGLHGTPKYDENGEYYFINGNNLLGKISIDEKTKRVSYEEYLKYKKPLNDRTILVSINGTLGNVATYNGEQIILGKSACYFNVGTNYDKDFIKYVMHSDNFKHYINTYSTGTTIKNMGLKQMRAFSFSVPPLQEQKAIANILSSLDEKIELNNQMNKTLEEMAQALFKRWFVDFEFPNEDGEPYKSSGGEMVDSELGMIPKGWKVNRVSELIEVRDGTHASPKPVKDGYPLVTSKHMNGDRLAIEQANLISEKDYIDINKRSLVNTGDILISMIGTVGLVYFVQEEKIEYAIKNVGLFKSSQKEEIRELLYLYLKSPKLKNYIDARLAGTTQKYISLGELRNIPIVVPDNETLMKFQAIAKSILDARRNNIVEIEGLVNLRDTLLPKLMSGEIRVTDLQN